MPNSHSENLKNKSAIDILRSPYFFVLAIILTITFGLLLLSNFRSSQSDISILAIPKNEASCQADQIMENLMDITHRLSFYDRVLYDNSEIKDHFTGFSKDERKTQWNKGFTIERLPGSTTLNISVFNQDKEEGGKIARQMALSLSEVASRFYNIQTELELRIIEGPISSTVIRSWHWLILESVLAGLISAYLFLSLFNISSGKIRRGINRTIIRRDYFSPPSKRLAESVKDDFVEATMKKASAPPNLPIADEEVPSIVSDPTPVVWPVEEVPSPITDNTAKGEPTDEEYRERLNKLLRGEI